MNNKQFKSFDPKNPQDICEKICTELIDALIDITTEKIEKYKSHEVAAINDAALSASILYMQEIVSHLLDSVGGNKNAFLNHIEEIMKANIDSLRDGT